MSTSNIATKPPTTNVAIQPFDGIHAFLSMTLPERSNVIKLGLNIHEHGRQIQLSEQNSAWQQQLTELKDKHATSLTNIKRERDELAQKIAEIQEGFSAEKAALSSKITETAHAVFKSQIDNLRERNDALETKLINIETDNRISTQRQMSEQRDFYETKLQRQTSDFEAIRNSYEERLNNIIGRNQNSTIKGKESEEEVFTMLNRLFPTAVIEDTHCIPGRGDFILRFDDMTMMVETKNYTRNVQKSEVDKFYRDMENPANNDIQCGVLMSMNCGISAHDDFTLEVRSGKPLLFLHNVRDNFTHIRLAAQMFRLIIGQKTLDLSSTELRGRLTQYAKNIKSNYQKQKNVLDKYYQQSLTLIETHQTQINELFTALCVKY